MNINRGAFYHIIGFIFLFFFILGLFRPEVMGKEQLQEEVTVIAVEVPVRILRKGQAVKDLTRDDFEIYENGIKQEITAFEVVSRKIATPREISTEELKIPQKKRLFLLIFNIFDYTKNVGDGIDCFFNTYFQPGDQIIIVTEDRLLNIERGKNTSEVIQNLKEVLKNYKAISTGRTYKAFRDLAFEADRVLRAFEGNGRNSDNAVLNFFDAYHRIWNDYKRQYLVPDIGIYQSIVKRIQHIEGEKWAICFLQREMFPRLKKITRVSRKIDEWAEGSRQGGIGLIWRKKQDLERSLDISSTVPTEVLRNLFMQANITFHLILMKSLKSPVYRDFELREVAYDYEDSFRQISSSTGGYITFSNNVTKALQEVTEAEDFYYMLVYQPKISTITEERKIEVKVNRSGIKLIYLKDAPKIEAPPITINDFKAGKKTISFRLNNYIMTKIKDESTGIVDIKITLFDENSNKVFDEVKTLNLFEKETHISLNFGKLKSGFHFIIIQVIDKIANEIDIYSGNIRL